jgi:hypothetical protein
VLCSVAVWCCGVVVYCIWGMGSGGMSGSSVLSIGLGYHRQSWISTIKVLNLGTLPFRELSCVVGRLELGCG